MYADRYTRGSKFNPASMGLALALNGTIVIGLIAFAAPHFVRPIETVLTGINIPLKPPPPPIPTEIPKAKPVVKTQAPLTPTVVLPVVPSFTPTAPTFTPTPTAPTGTIDGVGSGGGSAPPIKLTPVVIGPELDSRYAASFQPDYPADERRAEHQGRVVVRVLIGVDGRVKQVERVSAASDSFFAATERRALQKWRFKPGTRDGVPYETWKNVGVSFVLNDE